MTKKLVNMDIEEVSAVDKPATGKEFLIIKHEEASSKGGETVMTYEELMEKVDNDEIEKAVDAIIEDKDSRIEELEKKVEDLEKDEGNEEDDEFEKSELPEEVKEQIEKMEDEIDKAKQMAQIEKKKRLEVEFNKRAKEFDKVAEVDKTANILMKASEQFDEDTYEDLETVLKSAQARLDEAEFEAPEGEDTGGNANDPLAKLEDKAEEIAKDEGISKEKAFTKALEEYPELYREYVEEDLEG